MECAFEGVRILFFRFLATNGVKVTVMALGLAKRKVDIKGFKLSTHEAFLTDLWKLV